MDNERSFRSDELVFSNVSGPAAGMSSTTKSMKAAPSSKIGLD